MIFETSPILEMKGKGLAFDHGGRQIEVEEAIHGATPDFRTKQEHTIPPIPTQHLVPPERRNL